LWVEARSSLHPIKAESAAIQGTIEAEVNESGLDLSVPPKARIQIEVAALKTGNGLYDRELERRLEIRNYPRIVGEVLDVTEIGPDRRYKVRGNLSLHGVTKSVEGEVKLRVLEGSGFEIDGEQVFDMRDFGLAPPRILMLKVYPDVKVRAHVVVEKQA
jgi:polyisoprenoid-binding protein YceI